MSKKIQRGRKSLSTSKALQNPIAALFVGSLGNNAVGPNSAHWTAAVNCARSLAAVASIYSKNTDPAIRARLRATDTSISSSISHIASEIGAGRGELLFRNLGKIFAAGLEKSGAVASWLGVFPIAHGEAASDTPNGRPSGEALVARMKVWGYDLKKSTLLKAAKDLGLPVAPQGKTKAANKSF